MCVENGRVGTAQPRAPGQNFLLWPTVLHMKHVCSEDKEGRQLESSDSVNLSPPPKKNEQKGPSLGPSFGPSGGSVIRSLVVVRIFFCE